MLLGGTGEGRDLAHLLADSGHEATLSMAGATRNPAQMPIPMRVGGFGGAEPFAQWLVAHQIAAIIDATHPFATRISARSAAVAAALGLPYMQVLRPAWEAGTTDTWHHIAVEEGAAALIPDSATVFLATGRQTLHRFADLQTRTLICRQIDPPDRPFPFPNGRFLVGRPPFSVEEELALFAELGVDWLVVKNAGGAASRTKLDAAARLGLPVAMIDRPAPSDAPTVATSTEAMRWLNAL
nr:cobalt-precorrin-6A reductase [Actibacterium sp. 188UL27-1]